MALFIFYCAFDSRKLTPHVPESQHPGRQHIKVPSQVNICRRSSRSLWKYESYCQYETEDTFCRSLALLLCAIPVTSKSVSVIEGTSILKDVKAQVRVSHKSHTKSHYIFDSH